MRTFCLAPVIFSPVDELSTLATPSSTTTAHHLPFYRASKKSNRNEKVGDRRQKLIQQHTERIRNRQKELEAEKKRAQQQQQQQQMQANRRGSFRQSQSGQQDMGESP